MARHLAPFRILAVTCSLGLMLAGASTMWSAAAQAQSAPAPGWAPTRAMTLVVPYAAGGGTDAAARAIARSLSKVWNQSVVVENVPGAEGLLGTRRVMESTPDGYTLLMQVPSVSLVKYRPGYKGDDPLAVLVPVTSVADTPPAFVATGKVEAKTMAELIEHCKRAPKPCVFGAGENSARFQARKLASDAGLTNLIVVNFKGSAAIIPDLLSGAVTLSYTGVNASLPHHRAGTLKILTTAGPTRSPALPEVPTIREEGMPSFESVTWHGIFAPNGTAPEIVKGIAEAIRVAGQDPEVTRMLNMAGSVPVMNTPEEFAAQVREVQQRYGEMARKYPLQ